VTFLFTDIEDSTRLWERDAPAMSGALQRHDALLRGAVGAHDGVVFATGGDGVAAVFGRAVDAVRAAAAAQHVLAAEQWSVPMRVRMGVHTGEAEERDGDYLGPAVNRAARLMSVAGGGQVLVSLATAEVVRDQLGPDLALVELGDRDLRSLSRPEHVYELAWSVPVPPTTLEVRVLGPLQLLVDGAEVEVRGPKRRAALALLAWASPRPISVDVLCTAMWADDDGAGDRAALQSHVSRLRRHLGPAADRLQSTDAGYRLQLEPDALDAARAAALIERGCGELEADPAVAHRLARSAEALWRGHPLGEFVEVAPLAGWARTLEDLRLGVADLRAAAAIAIGDWTDALAASAAAIELDPLREASVLLHVQALAGAGRAAEALRAARSYRRRLVDETGLDPTPALAALEQVVAAGSPRDGALDGRPAPRPAERRATLFGRDAELSGVVRLLRTERLVTVVGPGGVGKTTVALEAVRRDRADREVTIVHLASVMESSSVLPAITSAVGLRGDLGDPLTSLAEVLASRPWLVVLDNCEHQLGAVRDVATALVGACADLTILATSRERLGLPFEQISRLAPLPLPADGQLDDLATVPSVALFVERAGRVQPDVAFGDDDLALVAATVRRLDGMPLAIELAAGRLSSIGLADLGRRLDRALDVLAGSPAAGERHATLRTAIEWSYDLLSPDEQRVFRSLAVFPDGFDLDTAELVARDVATTIDATTAIAHLVDASMIVVAFGDRPRYRMLDTLRAFGLDRLTAADEHDAAIERMLAWAVELAATIEAAMCTDDEAAAARTVMAERANFRHAWSTARATGRMDVAISLVTSLWTAAWWRELPEFMEWATILIDDPELLTHADAAVVFAAAADRAARRGLIDDNIRLARRGLAIAPPGSPGARFCLLELGNGQMFRGDHAEAQANMLAVAEVPRLEALAFTSAAMAATYGGQLDDARRLNARGATTAPSLLAWRSYIDGEIENFSGSFDAAERHYREACALAASVGITFLEGVASVGLVAVQAAAGKAREALLGYRALIDQWQRTGAWTQQWTTLRNLADLFEQLGDQALADALRRAADDAPESSVLGALTTATIAGTTAAPAAPTTTVAAPALTREEVLALANDGITRWLAHT
jgi:predicted ATPase/DNA-binding SARP family transcriptional activator